MSPASELSSRLLSWYRLNQRSLPWRDHPNPYAVWVSEIMLQQTRVEAVIPYFERWMERFPTVRDLAQASEQEVLNLWEGLGYYSRARNLHKAARVVVEKYAGDLPRDIASLRSLPGIGRYTAGAIASMAFGMDEPTLDGNLRRVFARLFDVTEPADSPAGDKVLWDLAARHLPPGAAGDYNQALMDLGAGICLPRNPRCLLCPLMDLCAARRAGTQEIRPVMSPKKARPHVLRSAAVVVRRGRVLLAKRPSRGLLGGMWEFPNVEVTGDPALGFAPAMEAAYGFQARPVEKMAVLDHAYTHFSVTVHAFTCELLTEPANNLKWVRISDLEDYPMGGIDRRIARKLS